MKKIEKHMFEAVSLLTVNNGHLDVTVIPAVNQPDWLVPSSLILSVDEYNEYIWTYLWRGQEVAVYQLIPRGETPDKIVVLEGNTDVHRVGLLTRGALSTMSVRISDVKDIETPEDVKQAFQEHQKARVSAENLAEVPYSLQTVIIAGQLYVVPDLDDLAHQLVDLDS